jgi:hypothetical protein
MLTELLRSILFLSSALFAKSVRGNREAVRNEMIDIEMWKNCVPCRIMKSSRNVGRCGIEFADQTAKVSGFTEPG